VAPSGSNQNWEEDRPFTSPSLKTLSKGEEASRSVPVLLIEDNAGDVLLIKESLKEHGFSGKVSVISDGERAVLFMNEIDANADTPCPGLIVLDLNIPKRNGREVLKRIRESSSRCAHVPVVILSSSNAPVDREDTARLGASRYICKPSTLTKFMEVGALLKETLNIGA